MYFQIKFILVSFLIFLGCSASSADENSNIEESSNKSPSSIQFEDEPKIKSIRDSEPFYPIKKVRTFLMQISVISLLQLILSVCL